MAKIVGLPKLSPTMEEGTLARWVKQEGDAIELDDLIAEIETDKATMEWRAFDRGVLLKILAPEGSVLQPEAPVAIVGNKGEDIGELLGKVGGEQNAEPKNAEPKKEAPREPEGRQAQRANEPAAKRESAKVPLGDRDEGTARRAVEPAPRQGPSEHDAKSGRNTESDEDASSGRVLASPLVRRLAREHDVDLRGVQGSGPGGRVIKRDLDEALAKGPATAKGAKPAATRGERGAPNTQKLSSMRRTIARRLTESKQTVPHFYLTIDVDAAPLMKARADINDALKESEEKVSVNDLVIKACAVALRRLPEVNASFAGDSIHFHQVVDISMAVAIPDGLVTPVIRDADIKGVRDIAREARDLAGRARQKKLTPEEMTNGTFSVSNLGMFGIEDFSAVINPPEGAILAVGTVREEPVVVGGQIVVGQRMRMTLSCDHRVIDGALGARWLQILRGLLEKPVLMLL